MGWTIILEDEEKKVISSLAEEFDVKLNENISNYKLLRYLDEYGDAIFNRLQMDDLIQDLELLESLEKNKQIGEIKFLAESCKKVHHTYLAFYGD